MCTNLFHSVHELALITSCVCRMSPLQASWYLNTIDPYAPHTQNIESRLRHPVHVVTRRILYGNVHATNDTDNDLEALFNDDDAEIKDGPETLTRRSAARMEAFLASCSVALREDHQMGEHMDNIAENNAPTVKSSPIIEGGKNGKDKKKKIVQDSVPATAAKMVQLQELGQSAVVRTRSNSRGSNSFSAPKTCPQIDRGDLLLRLEIYCRT